MKKRTNNRGFTLVELIIAVAILALVIAPLVANFIQSSKMNLQGRKSLNAMNLAQDIMEGMSGYTADEVVKIVADVDTDTTGTKTLVGSILPNSSVYDDITTLSNPGDQVVKYELENVVTTAGARNEYDVKITLNPTGNEHKEFNDKKYANISEINQYYDAVYTHDPSETDSMINELYLASNRAVQKDAFKGKIQRTFTIDIANDGTETAPNYRVSVRRDYEAVTSLAATAGLTSEPPKYANSPNISRMGEGQLPRSVYIYYQGIENASYNDTPRLDNILINNTTGKEITVYLIRAQEEGVASNIAYNQTYGCNVEIMSEDMMGNRDTNVHVVSNLRYDLSAENMRYNFRTQTEEGVLLDEEQIKYPLDDEGNKVTTSAYKKERATYKYNGAVVTESLYQSNFSDGYASAKKNALYKVLIEIYEKGTSNKVATYNGGLSN